MAKLSRQDIESLWMQAGGNPQKASTASAIALAESGGDTDSKNDRNSNGTIDRGLWQINSVHGSLSTFDPLSNARAAVSISQNGANWKPWCVAWSDGACGGTFMGAGAPVLKFLGVGGDASQTTTGGSLSQFQTAGLSTTSLNPSEWSKAILEPVGVWLYALALFALGAGLFGVGVWLLFRETQVGAAVERRAWGLAKTAIPGSGFFTGGGGGGGGGGNVSRETATPSDRGTETAPVNKGSVA